MEYIVLWVVNLVISLAFYYYTTGKVYKPQKGKDMSYRTSQKVRLKLVLLIFVVSTLTGIALGFVCYTPKENNMEYALLGVALIQLGFIYMMAAVQPIHPL